MPQRALLYRRPSEPQTIEIVFDNAVYPVRVRRHKQARRYTLRIQAATRDVVLTIPPRGTLKEAGAFAHKHGGWIAARLGRLPQAAPFADGAMVPLRGEPHRITHRRDARGTVWTDVGSDGERLLCVAGQAPHIDRRIGDYLRREAKARTGRGQPPLRARTRPRHPASHGARPVEPLGLLLHHRDAVVLLAAHPGAGSRARISRRARSGPPDRNESFGEILAIGATAVSGSRAGQGMARRARRRSASIWHARYEQLRQLTPERSMRDDGRHRDAIRRRLAQIES